MTQRVVSDIIHRGTEAVAVAVAASPVRPDLGAAAQVSRNELTNRTSLSQVSQVSLSLERQTCPDTPTLVGDTGQGLKAAGGRAAATTSSRASRQLNTNKRNTAHRGVHLYCSTLQASCKPVLLP